MNKLATVFEEELGIVVEPFVDYLKRIARLEQSMLPKNGKTMRPQEDAAALFLSRI